MEGTVTLYNDEIGWYHAYENDAIVISNVLGYKLYKINNKINAIGFPEKILKKVTRVLSYYNIGHTVDGTNVTIDYPNSRYQECLENKFKKEKYQFINKIDSGDKELITGKFTIQYNDEEPLTLKIIEDINCDADIVKFVASHEVGESYPYGEDIVKIISKNIEINHVCMLDQ